MPDDKIETAASSTCSRRNRNINEKRKRRQWDPKDYWGNQNSYPPPGPFKNQVVHSLLDYSIKIPPIPTHQNPWNSSLHEQLRVQPVFTKEQQQHNLMTYLRAKPVFENHQVVFPKWPSSKIELVGLSRKGTVFIRLMDEKNLKVYKNLKEYLNIWFIIHHEMDKLCTKIQKEDVQIGLIVLAKVSNPENEANNNQCYIRAKIVNFNSKSIYISGVDELVSKWICYDHVFYYSSMLNYCPFQIMECSFKGLENWENTFQMRVVMLRMLDIVLLGQSSNFWLKKFKKQDRKNVVVIGFPNNVVADNTSLNACILDQLKNFDFKKDCQITP